MQQPSEALKGRQLTAAQVAELLQVTRPTVYEWAKAEMIPAHKIGKRWRFRAKDYADEKQQPA